MKMKRILPTIKTCLLLFLEVATALHTNAQVVSSDICTTFGAESKISLKNSSGGTLDSIKSGLDFNLVLSLPGGLCQSAEYEVTITTSNNLILGYMPTNTLYPFSGTGVPNQFVSALIDGSALGLAIDVPFQFKAGVTCNNEIGTFNVTIKLKCDGVEKVCTFKKISLKAKAKNYWVVEKRHVFGDLSGGGIYWDVIIKNTNDNLGIGDLNIFNGSITDAVSSGQIISVTGGGLSGLTGLNTSTASWNTGTILSTTPYVEYRVQTYSCMPADTVVTNCVKYNFCLGKEVKLIANPVDGDIPKVRSSDSKIPSAASIPPPGGPIGPVQKLCCDRATGEVCASIKLVGTATTSANFSKSLTYDNNLNYAPGCEGEYQIIVSNNGNIPLNNLVITDFFPAGIQVFQISVTASGTSMDYDIPFGSTTAGFNTFTGPHYSQTWTSGFPTQFNLNTTSGTLLGGTIIIKIKFKILARAVVGTTIKNCADLNYNGTYDGWSNWCGIQLPPPNPNVSAPQSCFSFIVQEPKATPGISKHIIPVGQQSFYVGDPITFRIVVSNHGAASFSGNLADLLLVPPAPPGQNLSLVAGSVTYSFGTGPFNPYLTTPGYMNHIGTPSTSFPPWVTVTQQTPQNLEWGINNMPGNCELDTAYYLIIEYKATVLPQSFGNYTNIAKLVTPTDTLNGSRDYNVQRASLISTTKQVSTAFVEPGQSFNYIIVVKNEGSVALTNIRVNDTLPSCVTYTARSAKYLDVNGTMISSIGVTGGPPTFTFPSLILQPGESVELTVTVTRKADDQSKQCCNPKARGFGTTYDASADVISDVDGPVCVTSSLCCNIKDLNVSFATTAMNGGIVPAFWITGGTVPIQEIEISLIDYHAEYNAVACKPANMGNLYGHIQPFNGYYGTNYYNFNSLPFSGSPSLQLQTVVNPVNNSLTWSGSNPINLSAGGGGWPNLNFNGLIALNFIAPDIVNLDCCTGRVYYCFKVRVKDANCNVCEKIVCGSFEIPKARQHEWRNEKAKSQFKLKSLEGNQIQGIKLMNGESLEEFMKRNISK
jgi:uncharacterized repeat protein (TIGR01451 family)